MNKFIDVQNAELVFATRKGRFHALREINLTVAKGEFVTLIGHSGCGKSTLRVENTISAFCTSMKFFMLILQAR